MNIINAPASSQGPRPLAVSREDFDSRVADLRASAQEWIVRPHAPEGAVISALIGSIAELGDLAVDTGAALQEIVARAEAGVHARLRVAEEEVARLRWTVGESTEVLKKARNELANVEHDRKKLAAMAVANLTNEIVTMLKPHFVMRTVNISRDWMLRTWVIAGLAGVAIFLSGASVEAWLTWRP